MLWVLVAVSLPAYGLDRSWDCHVWPEAQPAHRYLGIHVSILYYEVMLRIVGSLLTLLEQNALQQRILVSQHEALIHCRSVSCIEVVETVFLDTDGRLELLYILGTSLTEGSLSLPVTLLSLLRGCIDLAIISLQCDFTCSCQLRCYQRISTYRLAASLPFRRLFRCGVCLATLALALARLS